MPQVGVDTYMHPTGQVERFFVLIHADGSEVDAGECASEAVLTSCKEESVKGGGCIGWN